MKTLASFIAILFLSFHSECQVDTTCLLELKVIDEKASIIIQLTSTPEVEEITRVFNKNGYKYKGFTWDNGIWEVVNQKDFGLLRQIDVLEEEETRLLVQFNSESAQMRFYDLICPILEDPTQLDKILYDAKKK